MIRSKICLLFLCYQLLGVVNTQRYFTTSAPSVPQASDFIRRGYHSCLCPMPGFSALSSNTCLAIVIGDYLYIDGGDIWQTVNGNLFPASSK